MSEIVQIGSRVNSKSG